MALKANALITLEEAKSWLGITGATDDAKLEDEINRASEAIEAYCDRALKRTSALDPVTVRRSSLGTSCLRVGVGPIDVTKAVTVTIDGTAQTVWKQEADGDPDAKDVVVGYSDGAVFHPGKPERALIAPDVLFRSTG